MPGLSSALTRGTDGYRFLSSSRWTTLNTSSLSASALASHVGLCSLFLKNYFPARISKNCWNYPTQPYIPYTEPGKYPAPGGLNTVKIRALQVLETVPVSYLRWLRRQAGVSAELKAGIGAALGIKPKGADLHRHRPVSTVDFKRQASGEREPPCGTSERSTTSRTSRRPC